MKTGLISPWCLFISGFKMVKKSILTRATYSYKPSIKRTTFARDFAWAKEQENTHKKLSEKIGQNLFKKFVPEKNHGQVKIYFNI